jgi:hypothetical protein
LVVTFHSIRHAGHLVPSRNSPGLARFAVPGSLTAFQIADSPERCRSRLKPQRSRLEPRRNRLQPRRICLKPWRFALRAWRIALRICRTRFKPSRIGLKALRFGQKPCAVRPHRLRSHLYGVRSSLYRPLSILYGLLSVPYGFPSSLYGLMSRLYARRSRLYALPSSLHGFPSSLQRIRSRLCRLRDVLDKVPLASCNDAPLSSRCAWQPPDVLVVCSGTLPAISAVAQTDTIPEGVQSCSTRTDSDGAPFQSALLQLLPNRRGRDVRVLSIAAS